MFKKTCPICGKEMHDDDMDRLILVAKAHIKTHEDEDETQMESTSDSVIGVEPTELKDDEKGGCSVVTDIEDEIVLTVTDITPSPTPNIAGALCEMQKADLGAITDSSNPFFNSKYADLSSVWGVIRKPLTDAGLSIMQYPEPFGGGITVTTRLYHVSGEMIETRLSGKTDKATIQGLGSLITYLRRYSISMLVGVAPKDDDDGNMASKIEGTKKRGGD